LYSTPDGPAQLLQPRRKAHKSRLVFRILGGKWREHTNEPHPLPLLRARRKRPRRGAAEKRDELAALHLWAHSSTSSARASSAVGISRPITFAVCVLMTNSNLVGNSTG